MKAWRFGEVFGRPFPEPLGRWHDADGDVPWRALNEARERTIDLCQCVWGHADATIAQLPIDASGHVPWWQPDVNVFNIMIHGLQETCLRAELADMLHRQIEDSAGVMVEYEKEIDTATGEAHQAKIERAAQEAASGSHHAISHTDPGGNCAGRYPDQVEVGA